MWSALSSGAASFGRILLVSLLPNGLLAVAIWAFVRAGSFSGRSDWKAVAASVQHANTTVLFLFVGAIIVLAVILQPFQIGMVRILEGYWPDVPVISRLTSLFVEHHQRRIGDLQNSTLDVIAPADDENAPIGQRVQARRDFLAKSAAKARAERRLSRYPFYGDVDLLPTSLGNALRTGETTAGERYGLDTLSSWPRVYPNISSRLAESADSARDALDGSVNLCVTFFFLAIISAAAAYHNPGAVWIPILALLLMAMTYAGAISAAVSYNEILRTAYDLHRFDMVKALHYKLPDTGPEESDLFEDLGKLFQAPAKYQSMDGSGRYGTGIAHELVGSPYDHETTKFADQSQAAGAAQTINGEAK